MVDFGRLFGSIRQGHTQVGASYARQAGEAGTGQASRCSQLLEQGKMPQEGWRDRLMILRSWTCAPRWLFREIEFLLAQLSQMDSNNFPGNCGVGEREARVYSSLVARFCTNMVLELGLTHLLTVNEQ